MITHKSNELPPNNPRDVFAKWGGNIWYTAFYDSDARWRVYHPSGTLVMGAPPDEWGELDTLNATPEQSAHARLDEQWDRLTAIESRLLGLLRNHNERITALEAPETSVSREAFHTIIERIDARIDDFTARLAVLRAPPAVAAPEPVLTTEQMKDRIAEWYNCTNRRDMNVRQHSWFLADPDTRWQANGFVDSETDGIRAAYAALVARFPEVAR